MTEHAAIEGERPIPCGRCGFDLRGVTIGQRCPECGLAIVQAGTPAQTSGLAIASMVLGIVSIITCMAYGVPGLVCGILAIVFARKGDVAIQLGTAPLSSRSMTRAGRICGIIGICLSLVGLALLLLYVLVILGAVVSGVSGGGPVPVPGGGV